jgi:hypothetical protein
MPPAFRAVISFWEAGRNWGMKSVTSSDCQADRLKGMNVELNSPVARHGGGAGDQALAQ